MAQMWDDANAGDGSDTSVKRFPPPSDEELADIPWDDLEAELAG